MGLLEFQSHRFFVSHYDGDGLSPLSPRLGTLPSVFTPPTDPMPLSLWDESQTYGRSLFSRPTDNVTLAFLFSLSPAADLFHFLMLTFYVDLFLWFSSRLVSFSSALALLSF